MKKLLIITALVLFAGVAYGQTLKKGTVISMRNYTFTLLPGVTMDQVEDFWINKYTPMLKKAYPGVTWFLIKGERGELINEFAELVYIESLDLRNKLWPDGDVITPYQEKANEIMAPISEHWATLVKDASVSFTDWVIL
ncbi:MAG: hypothetical protein KAI29_01195 [Cyclobacteriaceae bacterium]|nr:hypothetical protein [Cyclobacteriaceae bacterium]